MEKAKIRRIAVVLRLSYASGRDLLYGISQYARRKCRWQFHVINFQGDATAEELHSAVEEGKLDGMIANGADNQAIAKVLEASSIPLVVIGARTSLLTRKDTIAFVHNDEIAIGRRGAEYLASLGRFRSYGFIALSIDSCEYVPVLRERGFRSALGNVGCDVRTYATAVNVKLGSYDDINRLGEWLKALPKPAAIMAAHDLRATHVIEAAKRVGLSYPTTLHLSESTTTNSSARRPNQR